ncbi:hypothetical protein DVH24_036111 [Malus domestica]|uniref:Uncharacterized protein n=1 Tax=Malus domestica TaxID=3750 RepID=A0A498IEV7_MALDO|nr:hypothetical protein DVH24_036111 [Malus domestica]
MHTNLEIAVVLQRNFTKIFIEYIMLDGMNDEKQHAHQLGKFVETFQVINLVLTGSIKEQMLSAFALDKEPYMHTLEDETTPFGLLARGIYAVKLKVHGS